MAAGCVKFLSKLTKLTIFKALLIPLGAKSCNKKSNLNLYKFAPELGFTGVSSDQRLLRERGGVGPGGNLLQLPQLCQHRRGHRENKIPGNLNL